MQKVHDLRSLKEFSELYKGYKILNFSNENLIEDDIEFNLTLIISSLTKLEKVIEEFDSSTPITQITTQVVSEGFISEDKFIEVQLNIKEWQKFAKQADDTGQINRILSMLTGSH